MKGWVLPVLVAGLAGCAGPVTHSTVDRAQLVAADPGVLQCAYRLDAVVDERDASRAGGLSVHAFDFPEAATVVRDQLKVAGFVDAADTNAPGVQVRIVQLYLTQNQITKIPVAVYRVQVGDAAPVLLRAQTGSMNWNGTSKEAHSAYSAVLADIHRQVVRTLNDRCPAR